MIASNQIKSNRFVGMSPSIKNNKISHEENALALVVVKEPNHTTLQGFKNKDASMIFATKYRQMAVLIFWPSKHVNHTPQRNGGQTSRRIRISAKDESRCCWLAASTLLVLVMTRLQVWILLSFVRSALHIWRLSFPCIWRLHFPLMCDPGPP